MLGEKCLRANVRKLSVQLGSTNLHTKDGLLCDNRIHYKMNKGGKCYFQNFIEILIFVRLVLATFILFMDKQSKQHYFTQMKERVSGKRQQERKLNRQAIFALNRRFKLLLNPNPVHSAAEEDGNHTMVEVFHRMKYKVTDLERLVRTLRDEELEKVYEAVVGLTKLENLLIINIRQEELMIKLVEGLAGLVRWSQHHYLMKSGTNILHKLTKSIGIFNFLNLFNPSTLPPSYFIESITFGQAIFRQSLSLLVTLDASVEGGYISSTEANLPFLLKLKYMVDQNCPSSTLSMMDTLLAKIKLNQFCLTCRFNLVYFQLRRNIFILFKQRNMKENIIKMIEDFITHQLYQFRNCIHEASLNKTGQLSIFADFFIKMIDFSLDQRLREPPFINLIEIIIDVPTSYNLFSKKDLFNRAYAILIQEMLGKYQFGQRVTKNCLKIIAYLIKFNEQWLETQIGQKIISLLPYLYHMNELNQEINNIICYLISCQQQKAMIWIQQHNLLPLYLLHCTDNQKNDTKNSLKKLQKQLNQMKTNNKERYLAVGRIMTEKDCFKLIKKAQKTIGTQKVDKFFYFFQVMSNEINPIIIEEKLLISHQEQVEISSKSDQPQDHHTQQTQNNKQSATFSLLPNARIIILEAQKPKRNVIDLESNYPYFSTL